jgi:dihydroceramide fatty acyl 2-hydroxylase
MLPSFKRAKYYADFVSYPGMILALVFYDRDRLWAHPFIWPAMAGVGFLGWTLAEYWIHRVVLHGPYWMNIHETHHKRPKDLTNFPIWQLPLYFVVIAALTWAVAGDWWIAVFAGVMVGWVLFFVMHYVMHHYPRYIQDFAIRHNAHHKLVACNYGITVDWWDRVFGTYRA